MNEPEPYGGSGHIPGISKSDGGRVKGGIILGLIVAFLISLPFWVSTENNSLTYPEDKIVVECAEFGLWRVMASDSEVEFYNLLKESDLIDTITIRDLDFRLLLALEADGIVLGADEDPFGEHANYIAFKADFYRELFGWGKLPPDDIIEIYQE